MIRRPVTPEQPQAHPKGFDDFDLRLGDIMRGERATLGKSLLDVQRELKIKAAYIAAIENADPTAFETPGFIAGYVRSYARYLQLDPEWAFQTFCEEGSFSTAHGMSPAASGVRPQQQATVRGAEARDPFGEGRIPFVPKGRARFARVEPGALGSIAVLLLLIGGIGYGGWAVLTEVQKVRLAPVEQSPGVIAEIDALDPPQELFADAGPTMRVPDAAAFDRIYRPEALDVPVLVARDGPIAALDPASIGALAPGSEERLAVVSARDVSPAAPSLLAASSAPASQSQAVAAALAEALGGTPDLVQVTEAPTVPEVELLAVRPSWVRVRAADGTVIFEKILDAGERFELPQTEEPATLRAGNAGSLYFAVNGQTYGPAGQGPSVVKNVSLAAEALTGSYTLADLSQDSDLATYVAEVVPAASAPGPEPQDPPAE